MYKNQPTPLSKTTRGAPGAPRPARRVSFDPYGEEHRSDVATKEERIEEIVKNMQDRNRRIRAAASSSSSSETVFNHSADFRELLEKMRQRSSQLGQGSGTLSASTTVHGSGSERSSLESATTAITEFDVEMDPDFVGDVSMSSQPDAVSDDIPGLNSNALSPVQASVMQTLNASISPAGSPMNVEKHTHHAIPSTPAQRPPTEPASPAGSPMDLGKQSPYAADSSPAHQSLMASTSTSSSPMNLERGSPYPPSPGQDNDTDDDIEDHIAQVAAQFGDDPEEDGHDRGLVFPTPWTSTFNSLSARPFASPTKSVSATPVKRAGSPYSRNRLGGGPSFMRGPSGVPVSPFSPTPMPRKKTTASRTAEAVPWLKKMVKLHRQTEAEGISLCYLRANGAGEKSIVHSDLCRSTGGKGRAILYVAESKKDPVLASCREVMYEPFAHVTPRKNSKEGIIEAAREQISLDKAKKLLASGTVQRSPDAKGKSVDYKDILRKAVAGGKKVGKMASPAVQASEPYQKRQMARKGTPEVVEDITGGIGSLNMYI